MSRVARLAAGLSEPLLVTDGVNVRYLLGFQSSNCAVLVEPNGAASLYTDFRYLEAARAVEGVEVVQTRRDVASALSELLAGRRIGFEASRISYGQWQTLAEGGADLVPTRGLVEALRLVKDETEIDAIRRAAALSDVVYAALVEEPFSGAPRRSSPGGSRGHSASSAPTRSRSIPSSRPERTVPRPMRIRVTP